ncbi:MAG: hypothetical protein BRD50_04500 [Bacteroidetes bacterium SW_11_45_7]|nr:MAG: hypothetical protein BRD50_04500 [Bacteroidetes bacterium SW_11_45_7]
MNTDNINTSIIEGYMQLLNSLSTKDKLELIAKLTLSVKNEMNEKKISFYQAYGAWDSDQPAEELIKEIRDSRTFNRQIEEF